MARSLTVEAEHYAIAGRFTISRGSKTEAEVVTCTIGERDRRGRGECVPYRHYGETVDTVIAAIESMGAAVAGGLTREDLRKSMAPGAARNAVDCALWDLEAKLTGRPVWKSLFSTRPEPLVTAFTLSMDEPDAMAAQARANAGRPLLKAKIGGDNDAACIQAIVEAAPDSRIILDANEAWNDDNIVQNLAVAANFGIALVEQPLPSGRDGILARIAHPVPICADESLHSTKDLVALSGRYEAINIKLDKAGGLTEALALRAEAQKLGLSIMVGCMVGTSLAMAPAVLLAQDADFADLDGPLLLARDRSPGLVYKGSQVSPPEPEVWG